MLGSKSDIMEQFTTFAFNNTLKACTLFVEDNFDNDIVFYPIIHNQQFICIALHVTITYTIA